jgi:hypothetical protein
MKQNLTIEYDRAGVTAMYWYMVVAGGMNLIDFQQYTHKKIALKVG